MRLFRLLIVLISSVVYVTLAHSESSFTITGEDVINLGSGVSYLEDPSGALTADEVLKQTSGWKINQQDVFNKAYSDATWWLRLNLSNHSAQEDWLFVIEYPLLDYVNINIYKEDGTHQRYAMGDRVPFGQRPENYRYFVVPLTIPGNQSIQLLIQLKSTGAIDVPLKLWEPKAYAAHATNKMVLHGLYFGALIIIAVYNLLLYLAIGARSYIYYVGFVLSIGLFFAIMDGWAFQYFWPNSPGLNERSLIFIDALVCTFGALFARRFLDVPSFSKLLDRGLVLLVATAFIFTSLSLILPYSILIRLMTMLLAVSCVYALSCGIVALVNGKIEARYYIVAWITLFVGGISYALANIGVFPVNLFTLNAAQIGSALEMVLLSFALAERINHERAMRINAQQKALDLQIQNNAELELRVQERTAALEDALKKLEDLSNTDQLTGIKNRRFMDYFLSMELNRAGRFGRSIVVMLLDVDHFKKVNDTHGHLVGDECLKEIARRTSQQACRASDLVARYGGEEFCVVLPETDAEGAIVVAEKIRKSVASETIATSSGPLSVSISIGVCVSRPQPKETISMILDKADKALYESKTQGRNRSTLVEIAN